MRDAEEYLSALGIVTEMTDQRVASIEPDLVTRFSWRALRRARKLNEQRMFPSYRWEVAHEHGRWLVVAMQNKARAT